MSAQSVPCDYQWLAGQMGIDPALRHADMFDVEQCRRVVEICSSYSRHLSSSMLTESA